jgi:hypothetical protein
VRKFPPLFIALDYSMVKQVTSAKANAQRQIQLIKLKSASGGHSCIHIGSAQLNINPLSQLVEQATTCTICLPRP